MICRVGNGPAIFVSTILIGKFMKPYKIYTPRFGKPLVTFFDRKITRFKFSREKAWDFKGKWRYVIGHHGGEIWISVDVGVGFEPNHVQLLEKIKTTLPEGDWDNVVELAKRIIAKW